MSRRKRFRVSTIDEVWEFLHSFVVHAAQRNINLEGRNPVEADGGIPRLHLLLLAMVGDPDDVELWWLLQWQPYWRKPRRVQRLLGLPNFSQLEGITRGWEARGCSKPRGELRSAWSRMGQRLHDAYVEARGFPYEPFRPTQWAPPPPRDPHKDWVYEGGSNLSYLRVPNPDGRKLYAIHSEREGTQYKWIDGITGNSGEAPTAHAAKVAVEQDLVEHLRRMLAFMGAR